MNHIFIVNPAERNGKNVNKLTKGINSAFSNSDDSYSIYFTKSKGDATEYVRNLPDTHIRVYACGGDGTLNEVVNGAYGKHNIEVGIVPIGTGNDFVRNFENSAAFLDIDKQIFGQSKSIDLIKINDTFSINVCNVGIDSIIANNVNVHKSRFVPRKLAYVFLLVYSFIKLQKINLKVYTDNIESIGGDLLLCAIGNGQYYGGGFKALSEASLSDGMLDIITVSAKVVDWNF